MNNIFLVNESENTCISSTLTKKRKKTYRLIKIRRILNEIKEMTDSPLHPLHHTVVIQYPGFFRCTVGHANYLKTQLAVILVLNQFCSIKKSCNGRTWWRVNVANNYLVFATRLTNALPYSRFILFRDTVVLKHLRILLYCIYWAII